MFPHRSQWIFEQGDSAPTTRFTKGNLDSFANWQLLQTKVKETSAVVSINPFFFNNFTASKEQCHSQQCQMEGQAFFCEETTTIGFADIVQMVLHLARENQSSRASVSSREAISIKVKNTVKI